MKRHVRFSFTFELKPFLKFCPAVKKKRVGFKLCLHELQTILVTIYGDESLILGIYHAVRDDHVEGL